MKRVKQEALAWQELQTATHPAEVAARNPHSPLETRANHNCSAETTLEELWQAHFIRETIPNKLQSFDSLGHCTN
jgi:hypothetical protein